MIYLIIVINVLLNVAANVFLKLGMKDFGGVAGAGAILHMMRTPSIYMAVFFYGWAFAAYGLLLIKLDVSVAYPMMTGAIALALALVSRVWLGEALGLQQIAGIAMVVCGIWFLTR